MTIENYFDGWVSVPLYFGSLGLCVGLALGAIYFKELRENRRIRNLGRGESRE